MNESAFQVMGSFLPLLAPDKDRAPKGVCQNHESSFVALLHHLRLLTAAAYCQSGVQ